MIFILISIAVGYLLGSFPTAYIVVKLVKHADIRDIDVGNVGAAATIRQAGIVPGLIVAVIDIAKGAASILIARLLNVPDIAILCSGLACFLGHCFPVYLRFRGGQGTASVIGIFIVLTPYVTLIVLGLIGILLLIIRRIFPAICASGIFFPILIIIFNYSINVIIFAFVIIFIMVFRNYRGILKEIRHLSDIMRKKSKL